MIARLSSTLVMMLGLGLLLASCVEPPYVDTATPKDAAFRLGCIGGCGMEGRESGMLLEITFSAEGRAFNRQYPLCCNERAALRARLQTVADLYCDGIPVADKKVGDLIVGTTRSEATKKRGATIDDGEGYVAFNCDDWLPELIEELGETDCCSIGSGRRPSRRRR